MSVLDTLKSALSSVRRDAEKIASTLAAIRAEQTALTLERDSLVSAPMCKADLERHLHALVDEQGTGYPKRLAAACGTMTRRGTKVHFALSDLPGGNIAIVCAPFGPGMAASPHDVQTALCFLLPDLLKTGASRALEQLDFTGAGLPTAARCKRLGEIDSRLAALDAQETEIQELLGSLRAAAGPTA